MFSSRLPSLLIVFFVALSSGSVAQASVLRIEFDVSISTTFDYQAAAYRAFDFNDVVVLEVDLSDTSTIDYGTTTIRYGPHGSAAFSSPLTALVGEDPFGIGLEGSYSYVFPNVSD